MATGLLPSTRENLVRYRNGHVDSSYLWKEPGLQIREPLSQHKLPRTRAERLSREGGRDSCSRVSIL